MTHRFLDLGLPAGGLALGLGGLSNNVSLYSIFPVKQILPAFVASLVVKWPAPGSAMDQQI